MQDHSSDSEPRLHWHSTGWCCNTLTYGYVAIETGWSGALGDRPQLRWEPFLHEQIGGLGSDRCAAGTIEDWLWRTSPPTGFRDAPGQRPMVRKELFPEDKYARTFLHVALDGLEAGDSSRGFWIAGNGLPMAAGLCSLPRPRHPWLGLRPTRERSRILDLREHAAPS